METRLFGTDEQGIAEAAKLLRDGGLVAFPTETVYGLGADAMNDEAVGKVYAAKGRPSDNPMIVHVAKADDLRILTDHITEDMKKLIEAFWPGPLTMVVPARPEVSRITTGGLDTVAVRMPDNETALRLIEAAGVPLAGPSANLSGHPSPTAASHVYDDLHDKIDAVIQGENCRVGIESTVVDMTEALPVILRPGVITAEELEKVLGKKVEIDPAILQKPHVSKDNGSEAADGPPAGASSPKSSFPPAGASSTNPSLLDAVEINGDFKPKAPGMKYKHYAPKAEMIIFSGEAEKVRLAIAAEKMERVEFGQKVGVLIFDSDKPEEAAHKFFSELRAFDKSGVDVILAAALREDGVGLAVMNRMFKSAGYNIREVE